ncbi:DUF58 domain-containing protein [Pleomorphovibrio marinus]|uniref:DUF58 domain-containing protein n=1 Tax=Pleomorphovibrio marinus TaxID=2164132 RepID=UPI000E0C40E8|nr:DUF58 domain-containing protein [Pleomorphovibrio marinus]
MRLIGWFKSLFIGRYLLIYLSILTVLFLFGYWWEWLFDIALVLSVILVMATMWDALRLYGKRQGLSGERLLPEKLSNGDENQIELVLKSDFRVMLIVEVIDELPVQFQSRDFLLCTKLSPGSTQKMTYTLRPKARGEYSFGELHVFIQTSLGLLKRRFSFGDKSTCKVYPSFIHMGRYAFMALNPKASTEGIKKTRRLGHTLEFEHIKEYVPGDDIRNMNWKASAKKADLMVNVFQEQKSQPLYVLLDTGRAMKMPFNGLSLLDYGVNSALAFANVGLRKQDKVGLICFSNQIHQALPASNRKGHLRNFSDSLYRLETHFLDSDFGLLYATINFKIPTRSLLVLYTNFEHIGALKRQLPYLQGLNRKHLLVVVIFENTTLSVLAQSKTDSVFGVYKKTIAQKLTLEKRQMILEMERRGISCLLTPPEQLTVNTINRYLSIKAKNLL